MNTIMDFDASDALSFFSAADSNSEYPSLPDYSLNYDTQGLINPLQFKPEINYNEYLTFDDQDAMFGDKSAYMTPLNQPMQTPIFAFNQLPDIGTPYSAMSSPSLGSAFLSPPASNIASREASVCMFSPELQNLE